MTARGFGKRSQLKDGKGFEGRCDMHRTTIFNRAFLFESDLDKSWNFHKQETAFADDALLNDAIDANGQINDR